MKHTRPISRTPEVAQSSLEIMTEFLLDTKAQALDKFPRGGTGGTAGDTGGFGGGGGGGGFGSN